MTILSLWKHKVIDIYNLISCLVVGKVTFVMWFGELMPKGCLTDENMFSYFIARLEEIS